MDWRDEIKKHVSKFAEQRVSIAQALSKELNSLKVSPYPYHAATEEAGILKWRIEFKAPNVGEISFYLTINDLLQDDDGKLPEDLSGAIQQFLTQKIKDSLPILQ